MFLFGSMKVEIHRRCPKGSKIRRGIENLMHIVVVIPGPTWREVAARWHGALGSEATCPSGKFERQPVWLSCLDLYACASYRVKTRTGSCHGVCLATSYFGIGCCAALRNMSIPRYTVVGVVYEHLTRTIGDCILFEVFGGVMISGALITSVRQVGR